MFFKIIEALLVENRTMQTRIQTPAIAVLLRKMDTQ